MATEKRLIDANSLRNAFRKRMIERFDKDLCANEENCKTCYPGCSWIHIIAIEPTVDAVEVVHGQWIHDINNLYGCSECGERETMSPKKLKNYCPNCGADMRERKADV